MTGRRHLVIPVGCIGILMLSSCASDESGADFTLPVLRSVVEQTTVVTTSTTLPLFEEMYTIQEGDTLFEIAQAFGVSMENLISYNAISDPDAIRAGQVLKVPSPANPSGTTTTTTVP